MITTVLFDLDGTLLPMDQDVFTKAYFQSLSAKVAPLGYEPKALVEGVWAGTAAMVKNDGRCTNEEAFWDSFCSIFGEQARKDLPVFEEYYRVDFQNLKEVCGFRPEAGAVVKALKDRGRRVALATNPIFPAVATQSRIRWAGLEPEDFVLYTTYENSSFCKPNPVYFADVAQRIGCRPEECLMVGNDAEEDMAAREVGMEIFLLTDCLINRRGTDLSVYPTGGFPELTEYLESRGI